MNLNPISKSIVDKYSENCLSPLDKVPEGIVFYPGMPGKEELLSKMNSQIMENIKEKIDNPKVDPKEKKELEEKIRVFNEAEKKAGKQAMELQESIILAEKAAEMFFEMKNLLEQGKIEEIPKLIQNVDDNLGNLLQEVVKARTPEQLTPIEGSEARDHTTNLLYEADALKESLDQTENLTDDDQKHADYLSGEIDNTMTLLGNAVTNVKTETSTLEKLLNETKLFINSVNEKLQEETDDGKKEDDSNTVDDDENIKSTFADDEKEIKTQKEQVTNLEKEITTEEKKITELENELTGLQKKTTKKTRTEKSRMKKIRQELGNLSLVIENIKTTKNNLAEKLTKKLSELKEKKEILTDKLQEQREEFTGLVLREVNSMDAEIIKNQQKELLKEDISKTIEDINTLDKILDSYRLEEEKSDENDSNGYFSNSTTLKPFKKQIAV